MARKRGSPDEGAKGEEQIAGVQELVALGKSKGFVTFEEVNDLMDSEITDQENIENVLQVLQASSVEVRDDAPAVKLPEVAPEAPVEPAKRRPAQPRSTTPAATEDSTDYVRIYMRDMGAVPLLSREGEVEIAKKIEEGNDQVFDLVFCCSFGHGHLEVLAAQLEQGEVRVQDIVKQSDSTSDYSDDASGAAVGTGASDTPAEDEVALHRRATRELKRALKLVEQIRTSEESGDAVGKGKLERRLLGLLRDLPLDEGQLATVVSVISDSDSYMDERLSLL